jgi:hypothetical protein
VGGLLAVTFSLFVPQVIAPFAHGVPAGERGEGLFGGIQHYKYMRACYGVSVCALIGVVVTFFTRPEPKEHQRGLVWGTIADALRSYKGADGVEGRVMRVPAMPAQIADDRVAERRGEAALPVVWPSRKLAAALDAKPGDLVYLTDARWWFGGLHSTHAVLGDIDRLREDVSLQMDPDTRETVVVNGRGEKPIIVERLY